MTAPVTISGLSSGIDTNAVITSTLAIAAAPQNALKTSLNNLQLVDASYQAVNTKLAAVKSAADAVSASATWQATTATSSDSSVVATGSTSALAGTSTTFSVTALAKSQVSTIALADPAHASATGTPVTITTGYGTAAAKAVTITPASSSAADLVTAVNAANIGVKASLLSTSTGSVLQFSATATGAANAFNITGLTAGATNTLQNLATASDASITVGTPGAGGYSMTSSSNTFSNAIPGVSFTVSKLVSEATVSVSSDPSAASTAVQTMVSAMNSALLTISSSSGKGATLSGDSMVTEVSQQLLRAISGGSSSTGKSFSAAGLDINAFGIMTFNAAAFATAYSADPVAAQALVSNLSASLSAVGDQVSNASTGTLTQAISSDADQEKALTSRIADWDVKLSDKKTALTNKYAAMEAALSKLKSQSTYLTQMFGSSSSSSSSSSN